MNCAEPHLHKISDGCIRSERVKDTLAEACSRALSRLASTWKAVVRLPPHTCLTREAVEAAQVEQLMSKS